MDNRRLIPLLIFSFPLSCCGMHGRSTISPGRWSPAAPAASAAATGRFLARRPPAASAVPGAASSSLPIAGTPHGREDGSGEAVISAQLAIWCAWNSTGIVRMSESKARFVLFDDGTGGHVYLGQSGLVGEGMPIHKTVWQLVPGDRELKDGRDVLRECGWRR